MPKTTRRRSFNRSLTIRRWSKGKYFQNLADPSSDEEHLEKNSTHDNGSVDFSNVSILNNISDLFTLCTENISNRFISVLIYILG